MRKGGRREKVLTNHKYTEYTHSGEEEEEEEEEGQIVREEGVRERTTERRSGEEEEEGDEGAVGGGDREEREKQPIIPDPVTVNSSLPTTTVKIRLADGSRYVSISF